MTEQTRERIVVGVDGSPASENALRWARFVAYRSDASIEAVIAWPTVLESAVDWAPVSADWDPESDAAQTLDASLHHVFGATVPDGLRRSVAQGGATKVLLDASKDARMLIVGSRGHGGFAGLLLGSVSTACAEHATCPVLIIHGSTPPPG